MGKAQFRYAWRDGVFVNQQFGDRDGEPKAAGAGTTRIYIQYAVSFLD